MINVRKRGIKHYPVQNIEINEQMDTVPQNMYLHKEKEYDRFAVSAENKQGSWMDKQWQYTPKQGE